MTDRFLNVDSGEIIAVIQDTCLLCLFLPHRDDEIA